MGARRVGFSIVELLVVVVMLGILAAIAVPMYQKVTYRARAASIIHDFHVVRTAAFQYQAESHTWPPDDWQGRVPEELEQYLDGVRFRGAGYVLDWENWDYEDGPVLGISAVVEDEPLKGALLALLGEETRFVRLDDRFTYIISVPSARD